MTKQGTVRSTKFVDFTDPRTGHQVTRLTPRDVLCHRNYFYQKCFTNDGNRLIFGADYSGSQGESGSKDWNYHLLDLRDQSIVQLSDGQGENTFGGFLSPDDQYLYFFRGSSNLIRVELSTLREQVVYQVPSGWVGY